MGATDGISLFAKELRINQLKQTGLTATALFSQQVMGQCFSMPFFTFLDLKMWVWIRQKNFRQWGSKLQVWNLVIAGSCVTAHRSSGRGLRLWLGVLHRQERFRSYYNREVITSLILTHMLSVEMATHDGKVCSSEAASCRDCKSDQSWLFFYDSNDINLDGVTKRFIHRKCSRSLQCLRLAYST